jgi:starch synthase
VLSCFGEIYESPDFFSRQKGLFSELLAAPAAVVSSSRHCARSFTSIGVTRSIEAVYYGVELDGAMSAELRGKFRADRRIRPDEVVVLFMGRFVKEMGLDVLLRAAPLLLGSNQAIRLLIAGARGDLSAQAAAYAAVHEQRVHVMTDVPFSQQSAVYSAADILVAPSFNQRACMGMAIKEAMAASLPVVGGAGGGVPEAIADGETGLLVPLDPATGAVDVQQLVASVLRLAEDPVLRKALGAAGRRRAEHLFSHESTNRRMAEIFMAASPC